MPMGISVASRLRERLSTSSRKAAPASMEQGSSTLKLLPTSLRHRWGTTSPTQPIMPLTAMEAAVTSVAHTTVRKRSRGAFTPMALASSSPRVSRLSFHRRRNRGSSPAAMAGRIRATSASRVPDRLPMSQ